MLSQNQMGLNFLGQALSTQFLISCLTKETSNEYPGAIVQIMQEFAKDAASLATDGLCHEGQRVWLVHLNTKGDLPALTRMGSFKRSFWNCPRAPSSKKACMGICHLCKGGQEVDRSTGQIAFPFEDISASPCWEQTMFAAPAWDEVPDILVGVPLNRGEVSSFFALDVWHNFHLGVAKQWIASSFVVIAESSLLQGSIEVKFQSITEKYKRFCHEQRIAPWVTDISRDSLSWPQSSAAPNGKWNKGAASTHLMLFLSNFCEEMIKGKTDESILLYIVLWQ